MSGDRLRSELERLERSAPADLPPRPALEPRRGRSRWWVPAAAVVVAGIVVGIAAPVWLGLLGPASSARPTLPASTSPAPSLTSPEPGLAWHVVAFPDDGALLVSITNVNGRLILTGSLGSGPMAWYSDDGGFSWHRSTIVASYPAVQVVPVSYVMREVAGTAERLVAIGSRTTGPADAAYEPMIWFSTDNGAHWSLEGTLARSRVNRVLWDGTQFLAFEETQPGTYDGPSLSSTDGRTWQPMLPSSHARPSTPVASVALGSQRAMLVATDLSPSPEIWAVDATGSSSPVLAGGTPLHADAITVGRDGFVAIGPGDATGSERELLSGIGSVWTSRPFRLEDPAGTDPLLVNGVSDMSLGTLITGYAGSQRLAWFLPSGGDEASLVNIGLGPSVAVWASFVAVGDCGPTADCATYLVFGLPGGVAPPVLSTPQTPAS